MRLQTDRYFSIKVTNADTRQVPEGPFTFSKWVDRSNEDDDSLKLSAVWKNTKGEEHSTLLSCVNDIVSGKVSPQTKLYHPNPSVTSELIPSFPRNEIDRCLKAYKCFMRDRNRIDLTTKVIAEGPFSASNPAVLQHS